MDPEECYAQGVVSAKFPDFKKGKDEALWLDAKELPPWVPEAQSLGIHRGLTRGPNNAEGCIPFKVLLASESPMN